MFTEKMKQFTGEAAAYVPYPPAMQREKWEALLPAYAAAAVRRGEEKLGYAYPALTAEMYLDYSRTGNRARYETPYLFRRRALNDLILAECVEHKGRFMNDIVNGIVCICEETSWCLPAHAAACATGPVKSGFPSVRTPALDLFAAETGSQIALALWLLREELEAVSPEICELMTEALLHRVVRPYLSSSLHWMRLENDRRLVSNWTPWCTLNCLLVLFTLAALPGNVLRQEELRAALQKAAVGMDKYFDATGGDGCCTEGVRYYRHGALSFFAAAELMNTVTGGVLLELFTLPKYKNMAAYILHMHIDGDYYCNFNDCPQRPGACGAEEYLFAKAVGCEPMRRDVARDIAAHGYTLRTAASQNLFYHLEMAFYAEEISRAAELPELLVEDVYHPSTGIWVCRRNGTYLAVKGGSNNDPHNHNDVGTMTVFCGGEPVLIDIGVEAYSKATFSAERYSLWTMNSAHHNVMTFGEVQQFAGADAVAKVLAVETGAAPAITLELAGAYPAEAGVKSYIRRVEMNETGAIFAEDTLNTLPAGTYLTWMTAEKPLVYDSTVRVGNMEITTQGAERMAVEELPVNDETLRDAWQRDVLYRVKVFPAEKTLRFALRPMQQIR